LHVPIITIVIGGAAGGGDRLPPAGQPGRESRVGGDAGADREHYPRTFFIAPLTCLHVPIITIVIGGAAGVVDRVRPAGQPGRVLDGAAYTLTFFIAPLTCFHVPIITIVIGGAAGVVDRVRPAGQPGQSRVLDGTVDSDGGGGDDFRTVVIEVVARTLQPAPTIRICGGAPSGGAGELGGNGGPGWRFHAFSPLHVLHVVHAIRGIT